MTNHPTDEVLKVTVEAEAKAEAEKETETLDTSTENGDNEETQLNTRTDDNQPAHAEAVEITPDHPVYVEGKGWVWAENLVVGDRLHRADGGWAKVLAVERVRLDEPELVYNFTVKGPHTYFVLEVGVLVHNASCPDLHQQWKAAGYDPSNPKIQQFIEEGYAPQDMITLYRGQGELHGEVLSKAARENDIAYSKEMFEGKLTETIYQKKRPFDLSIMEKLKYQYGVDLSKYNYNELQTMISVHTSKANHLIDSPFIPTTTKVDKAIQFAAERMRAGKTGTVVEILLPKKMVIDDFQHSITDIPEGTAFDVVSILKGHNPGEEFEFSVLHHLSDKYIMRYGEVKMKWVTDPTNPNAQTYTPTIEDWHQYP